VKKVVVNILQGSVVTQNTLGGLTIHPPVANFLQCICAKNYENWTTVGKVLPFGARGSRNYAPPCRGVSYLGFQVRGREVKGVWGTEVVPVLPLCPGTKQW